MIKIKTKFLSKTKKASALVFSLMILTVMAIIAIAFYDVSLTNIRISTDTEKSVSSFQAADSGIELVMQKINVAASTGTDKSINEAGLCESGSPEYIDDTSLSGKTIKVAYFKPSTTTPGEMERILSCDDKLDDIKELRSVGEFGGTVRAVAVNVRLKQDCPSGTIDHDGITYEAVVAEDGRCWLKTNLGVNYDAEITSADNSDGYGWFFQWGRATDGHQVFDSEKTTTHSDSIIPGHGKFIYDLSIGSNYDWLNTPDDTLWQDPDFTNNPCPDGFSVPTQEEWQAFIDSSGLSTCTDCMTDAFNSRLKLTQNSYRPGSDGDYTRFGGEAGMAYYSSTPNNDEGTDAMALSITDSVNLLPYSRYSGLGVRCIKSN